MKKKIVSIAIVLCLAVTAIAGATLAYFTDTDADVNVMVSGNVKIVQNETDRNGKAYAMYDIYGLESNDVTGFKSYDPMMLYPAVYIGSDGLPYNGAVPAYDARMDNTNTNDKFFEAKDKLNIWGDSINNEIDKVISVTNKGSSDIYVRTIVLMENTLDNKICEKIHGLWCTDDGQYREWVVLEDGSEDMYEAEDGTLYSIAVCTYKTPLAAGATTSPSLVQLFLDPTTTNDWSALLDPEGTEDEDREYNFDIIAFSQAVQIVGFEEFGSEVALNTAFGEVNSENVKKWLDSGMTVKTTKGYNVIGGYDQLKEDNLPK